MIKSYYDKRVVGCPGGEGGKPLIACPFTPSFRLRVYALFLVFLTYGSDHMVCNSAEDEHDVVWFWLEKGKPHECPVCAQYFVVSRRGTELIKCRFIVGPT